MANSLVLLQRWIDAFQRRDIDALVAAYAPDAVNHQVAAGAPSIGHAALRSDFEAFFIAFPDSYANVVNRMADGDWAAWEWEGGGTFTGPFLGHASTGRAYTLRGCGFFHFQTGLIATQRGYWDRTTWFSQIGLPLTG